MVLNPNLNGGGGGGDNAPPPTRHPLLVFH